MTGSGTGSGVGRWALGKKRNASPEGFLVWSDVW